MRQNQLRSLHYLQLNVPPDANILDLHVCHELVEGIPKLLKEAVLMVVGLQKEKIAVVPQSCEGQKVEKLWTKCQRGDAWQDAD